MEDSTAGPGGVPAVESAAHPGGEVRHAASAAALAAEYLGDATFSALS